MRSCYFLVNLLRRALQPRLLVMLASIRAILFCASRFVPGRHNTFGTFSVPGHFPGVVAVLLRFSSSMLSTLCILHSIFLLADWLGVVLFCFASHRCTAHWTELLDNCAVTPALRSLSRFCMLGWTSHGFCCGTGSL